MRRFKTLTSRRAIRLVDEVTGRLRPSGCSRRMPTSQSSTLVRARPSLGRSGSTSRSVADPSRQPTTVWPGARTRRCRRSWGSRTTSAAALGSARLVERALAQGLRYTVQVRRLDHATRQEGHHPHHAHAAERAGWPGHDLRGASQFAGTIPGTSLDRIRELLPRMVSEPLSEAELDDLGDRLEKSLGRRQLVD